MKDLPALLDRLEAAAGPADPVPSAGGWELVCRRKDPACAGCAIAGDCPSAGHPPPLY